MEPIGSPEEIQADVEIKQERVRAFLEWEGADLLAEQKRLYAQLGYPEEWNEHFQGGITGYTLADPARCLDPHARVVTRQAHDYLITLTGAKFEELTLLTENGVEFASLGPGWPTRSVSTPQGGIEAPDVMMR